MNRKMIKEEAGRLYERASCLLAKGYGGNLLTDFFVRGALWRINSAWHDIDKEKPMPGKHVVNEHWFDFVAEDWKDLDRIMKKWPFKRWAYVDDLMPDGKEDEQ